MAVKKSELYSSLWKSCDELRGGMDASQYKNYVLVLLFVKYVSDKYAGREDALLEVPEGGSFADMVAAKGKKDIGERLNKIIAKLAEANRLNGVINVPEADFNDDNKLGSGDDMVQRLTKLVAIFENPALNFTNHRAEDDDLLGDAYEYLMRHFATESGKSKGQFYTPAEVSRVMAKLVGVAEATSPRQTIYDPTCGSGSLLLKAADEALPIKLSIYGQEMDNATYALARMNMILHGHDTADLVRGNTLSAPATWDAPAGQLKQHDFVVANPPFSTKSWTTGLTPEADVYGRFTGFGVPPAKNGDYAFLLHILRSLKGDGKGVVVLPHGVLFRGNAEAVIRRNLVQRGVLKGIIGLPPNLFYGTGIPAALLVLDKAGAALRTGIFMMDASRGFIKDGNKNRLREQDIHRIVDVWRRQQDEPHYARMVPVTEIASPENDYNLNLPRYVTPPPTQDRHDIEAHLRGGLPAADLDALSAYWDVYPTLRGELVQPQADRPGYYQLRVAAEDIRPTIYEHAEFRAFSRRVEETFAEWVARAEPLLRSMGPDTKPKQLLHTLSEELLATFGPVHLLDGYDVYQRLMNYWAATLQDDVYQVVAEGWDAKPYQPLVGKKQKRGPWTSDLVPRSLLISRYLAEEEAAVQQATEALAEATRRREELEEEHTGEEGLLSELEYSTPAQLLAAVKARRKELLKAQKTTELRGKLKKALTQREAEKAEAPTPLSLAEAKAEAQRLLPLLKAQQTAQPAAHGTGDLFGQATEADAPLVAEAWLQAQPAKVQAAVRWFQEEGRQVLGLDDNTPADTPAAASPAAEDAPATPAEELAALTALEAALMAEDAAKKTLKAAAQTLEDLIGPTYLRLTADETQDLLVTYKWLTHLHHAVAQELSRLSQALARRLDELGTRYATPLPAQEAAVAALTQRVQAHLAGMGFSWK
ncbi:type I restriction-modification system subunit M [Hymenobacter gummosus]|uniref:type I restriction-modification system subunit M n=1 Tax=Hymenobacter gummosus TaxID=1776032 RepID=UPI001A9CCB64|nr:class I SAM-dependent DNA methyltransferase [Hymenobacter gummosus]